jgi:hypothetical protein
MRHTTRCYRVRQPAPPSVSPSLRPRVLAAFGSQRSNQPAAAPAAPGPLDQGWSSHLDGKRGWLFDSVGF